MDTSEPIYDHMVSERSEDKVGLIVQCIYQM
jgi:hypothetical protein